MKKVLVITLALAMLFSTCYIAVAEEQVTLKVAVYERGNTTAAYGTATDNYWTRWIQEKFGDPNGIKLEYVPIPRGEDNAKINTLMAANSAPDIIFLYDATIIMNFGKDGGLHELTDLIEEHAPNITMNLADTLRYGQYKGSQYAVVALRSGCGRYSNFIRKDWLDEMGYELQINEAGLYHMSIDDFTKVLYKAKELDLDKTGMPVYPFAMSGAFSADQNRHLIYSFLNLDEIDEEALTCYPDMMLPGYREGVRYLNMLYNDGIIDPDFMVDTDSSMPAMSGQIATGRSLAYAQDGFYKTGVEALYEVKPDAEFVPFLLDGVSGKQYTELYDPTGMYIAIPKTCEHPDAAIKYLNFLADYETYMVLGYGFEGVHYNMVGGLPVPIKHTDEELNAREGLMRTTCGDLILVYNGNPLGYPDSTDGLEGIELRIQQLLIDGDKYSLYGGRAPYYFQGIETEAEEQYRGFLPELSSSLPALVACAPEKFDEKYDAVLNEYLVAGGQAIIDDAIELYRELESIN